MIILGIAAYHGDCSASILKDGCLLAAVEEERFKRIKHWAGFPEDSIRYCLEESKVDLKDVDYIAVARDTKSNLIKKIKYVMMHPSFWENVSDRLRSKRAFETIAETLCNKFNVSVDSIKPKIKYVEHHLAHLASAFLVSPFKESALISVDGFGDFLSAMYGVGKENRIEVFKKIYYPHSIGIFYTMITQYLGFKKYGDEYKVMGLAAYGEPSYLKEMEEVISYIGSGEYVLNMKYFTHAKKKVDFKWESNEPEISDLYSELFVEKFGKPRKHGEELTDFHRNLAASAQKITENLLFKIMNYVFKSTDMDKLSLAGGVAMNSVANGKIHRETKFKDVFIPPAAGDGGTSVGAAFFVWNQLLGNQRTFEMKHGNWGPAYDFGEIQRIINLYQKDLPAEKFNIEIIDSEDDLINKSVDFIIKGKILGWFQGRMEFGARALGNRSILVDPRRPDMKDILNARIKKREKFRPFAPSILIEKTFDWFDGYYPVPFMEKVYNIKEEKRDLIPSVTHIDGTGRLQTVYKDQNPLYYKLIRTFEQKTGVPVLLNTSFNENEPIVCTPQNALEAFIRTKMDGVVLNKIMIVKK